MDVPHDVSPPHPMWLDAAADGAVLGRLIAAGC